MVGKESLYSNEVRQYFNSIKFPLPVEIIEFEDCLKVRIFRQDINRLDSDQKLLLVSLLREFLYKVWSSGIPIYTWKDDREADKWAK